MGPISWLTIAGLFEELALQNYEIYQREGRSHAPAQNYQNTYISMSYDMYVAERWWLLLYMAAAYCRKFLAQGVGYVPTMNILFYSYKTCMRTGVIILIKWGVK